jgi:hypothetical protein
MAGGDRLNLLINDIAGTSGSPLTIGRQAGFRVQGRLPPSGHIEPQLHRSIKLRATKLSQVQAYLIMEKFLLTF